MIALDAPSERTVIDGSEGLSFVALIVLCTAWFGAAGGDLGIWIALSLLILGIVGHHIHHRTAFALPSIFLIGLLYRLHFQSFTGFSQVPGADANLDLFVVNVLSETGRVTIIEHELYDNRLTFYSSWPLSQLFVVVMDAHSSVGTMAGSHIAQSCLYAISFLLIVGLLRFASSKLLDGNPRVVIWGMVLFACLPELNYWQGELVRQNLGILATFFFISILLRLSSSEKRYEHSYLLVLSAAMLGFSHNFTSAVMGIVFVIFTTGAHLLNRHFGWQAEDFLRLLFNGFAMFVIFTVLWWSLIGDVLFPRIQSVVLIYVKFLSGNLFSAHDPRLQIDAALAPIWLRAGLHVRDLILLGGTASGFLLFVRDRREDPSLLDGTVFLLAISFFLVFAALFLWSEPFRILTLASPIMALMFGYLILRMEDGGVRRVGLSSVIVMLLAITFVSPFGHTHGPLFFYDDELDPVDYGMPGDYAEYGIRFLIESSHPETNVTVDYPDYAAHATRLDEISRFRSLDNDVSFEGGVTYERTSDAVMLVRDANLYQHNSAQATEEGFVEDTKEARLLVLGELALTTNLVYSQGDAVSVWIAPRS